MGKTHSPINFLLVTSPKADAEILRIYRLKPRLLFKKIIFFCFTFHKTEVMIITFIDTMQVPYFSYITTSSK